jgi:hypothetical protein
MFDGFTEIISQFQSLDQVDTESVKGLIFALQLLA